jgi:hypothetical protein
MEFLKSKIMRLEQELSSSKREIESFQKSGIGQTTFASGGKLSAFEGRTPESKYSRYSGLKLHQGSPEREEEEESQGERSQVQSRIIPELAITSEK